MRIKRQSKWPKEINVAKTLLTWIKNMVRRETMKMNIILLLFKGEKYKNNCSRKRRIRVNKKKE